MDDVDARRIAALLTGVLVLLACGDGTTDAGEAPPYVASVESFEPGDHAGFGAGDMPEVVLGPPAGEGDESASMDVVSLGVGGSIVLGFGELMIVDGRGADFVVFENPFWPLGDPDRVFAELARVSVSSDGEDWKSFECEPAGELPETWQGCAGWRTVQQFDPGDLPLDPERTGGDPFDLADLGMEGARFVRIEDLSEDGAGNSAGFDLDAVGLVHHAASP